MCFLSFSFLALSFHENVQTTSLTYQKLAGCRCSEKLLLVEWETFGVCHSTRPDWPHLFHCPDHDESKALRQCSPSSQQIYDHKLRLRHIRCK